MIQLRTTLKSVVCLFVSFFFFYYFIALFNYTNPNPHHQITVLLVYFVDGKIVRQHPHSWISFETNPPLFLSLRKKKKFCYLIFSNTHLCSTSGYLKGQVIEEYGHVYIAFSLYWIKEKEEKILRAFQFKRNWGAMNRATNDRKRARESFCKLKSIS